MCGIFGYVGARAEAPSVVLDGLKKLEYRGYDSWGIAVKSNGHAAVDRRVGKIGQARTDLPASPVGLGHTRWATHGGVTERNAHPHLDCLGRLAVIHNGIVENYHDLKGDLVARGHRFASETDSEVIAHLIEDELARRPADTERLSDRLPERLKDAMIAAFRRLDGLNAVAVLDVAAGTLVAAKSGSPLVLGWGEGATYLASDPLALVAHTRRLTFLEDGQVALLGADGSRLFEASTGHELAPTIRQIDWQVETAELGDHPHFMVKEIAEQPGLVRRIADDGAESARRLAGLIGAAEATYLVGCGTAAHAALAGQYLLARVAGRRASVAIASEFPYQASHLTDRSLLIGLSQSGETIDVLDAVAAAQDRGARVAALVNVEGSSLHRRADHPLLLGAGPERCVLATKSFTAKLAFLFLTAYELADRLDEGRDLLRRAADEIAALIEGDRRELIGQAARIIHRREHLFVIGRGPSYPLALESALKIKEVSYIHAEGLAGGELKHGVIALVEEGTPCVVLAPRDETRRAVVAGAMEVKARGGFIIGVSPDPDESFDLHVPVAEVGDASVLVEAIPTQLLAYDLALLRGCDPDKPRNLAKSVTVR